MIEKKSINRPSILITGGSGMVGKHLTALLLSKGYVVSHLSRTGARLPGVNVFKWNPEKGEIDPRGVEKCDYIIHLAGSNIGEKRWTKSRKREIVSSRVNSANILYETVSDLGVNLRSFISASATGYYGSLTSEKIFVEDDPSSNDFLGNTCRIWEEAAERFGKSGIRTVKIRTSVVLDKNEGVLPELMRPAKYGLVVRAGNGHQYMPWIHIADLCNIYLKAIEDEKMIGAFNAVSPYHVSHNEFIASLASKMKRAVFLPPIPEFVIKFFLGEMSGVLLKGSRISSQKIKDFGFRFLFENLQNALDDLLNKQEN